MTDQRRTVTHVEPLEAHWIRVRFADGGIHEVDLAPLLALGGAFAATREDRVTFESVRVDPEFARVGWPGGIDLDPDVLRGDVPPASGVELPRRIVQPT